MKKTRKTLLFPLALFVCSLASCAPQSTGKTTLWSAFNTENLMADLDYSASGETQIDEEGRGQTLSFNAMKGETESAQLMISVDHDVNSFDLVLGDLSDGQGNTIASTSFSVYAEKYLEAAASCEKDAYPGYYPDALVPLASYQFRKQNHIYVGTDDDATRNPRNQGIWVNLKVASDAVAGTYSGKGTLTLDNQKYEIPLSARIYDAAMPEELHQQTCFLIWYDLIPNGEGKNSSDEMSKAYYDFCVDHRISPDQLPSTYLTNWSTFTDYYAANIANNPKITGYRLPLRTGSTTYESDLRSILQLFISKNIALRKGGDATTNLFKKIYSYVDDEPTASSYDTVRNHGYTLKSVVTSLSSQLNDYPDLKSSLLDLKNIVTTPFNDSLVDTGNGGVNTWCPQFQHFQATTEMANYHARQKLGEHVWWYGCITPASPYPSYHMDASLMSSRLLGWMQYDYGIEGNLYWCVNYYSHSDSHGTSARDIWNDPNTWENCNGDGQLVYPGLEYGIKGPISTLRLESIRESLEDYEYLWLFNSKIDQYNQENGKNVSSASLLQKLYYGDLFDGVLTSCDSATFAAKRISLLSNLEAMNGDLKTTVETLLNS
jgi:hypothetical protein